MSLRKITEYNLDKYCLLGNMRMIKRLVAHGVDINARGDFTTPLFGAIESGSYNAVKYLLDHGAEFTPWDGQDALYIASGCGNPKIIDLLREYGVYTYSEPSLLLQACRSGCMEMVNRFIAEGEEIQDDHFWNACEGGNMEVLKTLFKIAPDKYDKKCLEDVVDISHPEMVEFLIEQGEDVNKKPRNDYYTTILDMAIKNRFHTRSHKRYVANSKNKTLRQAAKAATSNRLPWLNRYGILYEGILRFVEDRKKVIDILLKQGATPIEQEKISDGDFIKLCKAEDDSNYTANITDMLSRGANVHERDEENTNAMHMAFCRDYPYLAKILTLFGMDINTVNETSASQDVTSNRFKHKRMIRFYLNNGGRVLETYGSDYHNFIASIINMENTSDLQKILQIYPDINHPWDNDGNTFLHYATQQGKTKMINRLLKLGADVNVRNAKGMTPLMYTTDINTAERLISLGTDPNDTDNIGNTALYYTKSLDMTRFLVKNGTNINHQNNNGDTALDYWLFNKIRQDNPAAYLINNGANIKNKNSEMLANQAANASIK